MGRLIGSETELVDLGEGDFAEILRRMSYGVSRQLAAAFEVPKGAAHSATDEYMAKILELNLKGLRGPGFGCTLQHAHGDPAQTCDTPAVTRELIDSLDPSDSELLLDAINVRNRSRGTRDFIPRPSTSSADEGAASAGTSPIGSPTSTSAASSDGPSVT